MFQNVPEGAESKLFAAGALLSLNSLQAEDAHLSSDPPWDLVVVVQVSFLLL